MDAKELAREVVRVLDMQKDYFRTKAPTKLNECRDAERRLRATCDKLLNPPVAGLFDQPQEG
jgi:hypothetical protein